MRVIIFGAGNICRKILSYPLQDDVEILFVCDNNESRWGQKIAGYAIRSPKEIYDACYDLVIIACLNYIWVDEMRDQLSLLGVPDEKDNVVCGNPWDRIFRGRFRQSVEGGEKGRRAF